VGLTLVDEWIGLAVELAWSRPAQVNYGPIYTLSLSEAGFERIYQGTSLLLGWAVGLAPLEVWEETLTITITER
jgi:alpha-amylase